MRPDRAFGYVGDAQPVQRRFYHQPAMVQCERARHVDRQFLTASFELPAVALSAWQTLTDAAVAHQ